MDPTTIKYTKIEFINEDIIFFSKFLICNKKQSRESKTRYIDSSLQTDLIGEVQSTLNLNLKEIDKYQKGISHFNSYI